MTEKEKMLSGQLYNPADNELAQIRYQARKLLKEFNHSEDNNKSYLLKQLFGKTGENIYVEPYFHCDYGENIYVGENFYANFDCIILDEAQNTTPEQMKMFLTRLGFNSKMVITGDVTQIDLPDGRKSGLKDVMSVLKHIDDIAQVHFNEKDVVRHRLVQNIIKAYEEREGKGQK